ncbi:MAG: GNAT family N-acetyltransferase [Steroidobacter sp.]
MDTSQRTPLFECGRLRAISLAQDDAPLLQKFFEDNAGYFFICNGRAPLADEALREMLDEPPKELSYANKWVLGFIDQSGDLVAMAIVLSDFIAPRVWLISLFIVATTLHGTGRAQLIYRDLEHWIQQNGAEWIRLGVVKGNMKAARFWGKMSYVQVRERHDVPSGIQVNTLRVMVKGLCGGLISDYLSKVSRDRPEM